MNNLDKKSIWTALLLFIIVIPYYFFDSYYLNFFKNIFESKFIYWLFGAYSFVMTVIHKMKFKSELSKKHISFTDFKNVFDVLINPAMIVTSFSLAKGLFLQYFFQGEYFKDFSQIELFLLTGAVGYVLYLSFQELRKLTVEAFKIRSTEKVEPQKNKAIEK